jgi:ubiquinone/menaquinone biosynthesis C-methylase UbiE
VGCGTGRHTIEICRWDCRAVAVDVSLGDLRTARLFLAGKRREGEAKGGADFVAADAEHLPFRAGAFDKVVCTEVLEHIPDDKAGISELVRVLKLGALIAVSVPNYIPEVLFWTISWGYWHSPGGHIRIYQPGEMAEALGESGLEIYAQRMRHTIQTIYWFFRCTFGIDDTDRFVTRYFQRFVQWHYRRRLRSLEYLEALANLVLGKDLVLYARKPPVQG